MSRVIKPIKQVETTPLSITFDDIPLVNDSEGDKSSNVKSEGNGLEPCEEALKSADAILKEATREAESIVIQARLESEQIRESAFSRGFSEGKEQGLVEGRELGAEEFTSSTSLAKRIYDQMQTLQTHLEKENHEAALMLALGIAKKLVKKEVLTDEDTVMRVIADALGTLVDLRKPETVLVRVNPQEAALVEGSTSSLAPMLTGVEEFSIEPDPSVSRGGCVLETNLGCVDAKLETQFDAVEMALLQRMEDVLADEYES